MARITWSITPHGSDDLLTWQSGDVRGASLRPKGDKDVPAFLQCVMEPKDFNPKYFEIYHNSGLPAPVAHVPKFKPKKKKLCLDQYMDLQTAHGEIATRSLKKPKKPLFISVDGESMEATIVEKRDEQTIAAYLNGVEVPLDDYELGIPAEKESPQPQEQKNKTSKQKSKTSKKMATATKAKKAPAKTAKKTADRPASGERVPRGNNMYLTPAEWKKVDALLAKEEISFSAWSRGLVLAKIK